MDSELCPIIADNIHSASRSLLLICSEVLASSGVLPPFIVYQSNIKRVLISEGQVNLATADIRHIGRHDRHELDVGIEWQTRHV